MSQTLLIDMLGGLAKANTCVAKPEGHNLLLLPPRHARGLGSKPTQGSFDLRISSLISTKPPVTTSMLGGKRVARPEP
jgi:hypothetical protein